MTRTELTRRTQHNLYLLRRQFGASVTVYRLLSSGSDTRTGERTTTSSPTVVDRAVVLPGDIKLNEIRGISLISTNKLLVQGGQTEVILQGFIIDARDIPFEPSPDDWLVYDDRRFDFAAIWQYENKSSWLIGGKATPGRARGQQFDVKAEDLLTDLTQEAAPDDS